MKRSWKGTIAGLTAPLLLALPLAACSSSGKSDPKAADSPKPSASAQTTAQPSATPAKAEEPIELTWLSFNPPEADGSWVELYLEKKFNVKIKAMRIDRSNWQEQLNVKLAAKEVPDVFFLWDRNDIKNYSKQGLLAELPVKEIKEKMPAYSKTVDDWNMPYLWNNGLIDGKNYAIPMYRPDAGTPNIPAYNKAWLKAIGYNEPPKTLKELEDVLYKFRNNDPDGNGKKDTFGISARGKDALNQAFRTIFYAYQIDPFKWVDDPANPSTVTRGIVTENAREALKFLNKLLKDGVINPEFITEDYAKSRQNFAAGKVGYLDGGLWYHLLPNGGSWTQDFLQQNPNNEVVIGPQLEGPHGKAIAWVGGIDSTFVGIGSQVDKDPKKKAKIFEMLNALATDPEVYVNAVFGQAGVSYDLVDGVPKLKPDYADPIQKGAKIGAGSFFGMFEGKSTPMMKYDRPADQLAFRAKAMATAPKLETGRDMFNVPTKDKYPDLDKLEQEYFIKFISGNVDLDKGFDSFVELWKKSGGQAIQDEINTLIKQQK